MCVGESFLSLGQFSSMISLKVLCSPLTWDSSPSPVHRISRFDFSMVSHIHNNVYNTLYQLSYIPRPTAHYLIMISSHDCGPVRKITFPKCIYIHFLNFSKSTFNFLEESWSHCQVSVEAIKKYLEAGRIPWGIKMFFDFLLIWCYFYFSIV